VEPSTKLAGTVYDENGDFFSNELSVTLDSNSVAVAGSRYDLSDVSPGTREIKVVAEGYDLYSESIAIIAGETNTHDIHLIKTEEPLSEQGFFIDQVVVPGALEFPVGLDDSETGTDVDYSYYVSKHEVSYKLWKEIFDWAASPARGSERYYFENEGVMGNRIPDNPIFIQNNELHPVTGISWWDAVVWCNALTEYYNVEKGETLRCVYTNDGAILRDARHHTINEVSIHAEHASGYRLPTSIEWELAARYVNGYTWDVRGNHVSGDSSGSCYPENDEASIVFGDYAWYKGNSRIVGSTHPGGEKAPNHLGVYDMSGNVWELCWDHYSILSGPSYRIKRGGSFRSDAEDLQLGIVKMHYQTMTSDDVGFRTVRTK
jgi:formylglycine-generating enzyme required for sulfatase activity